MGDPTLSLAFGTQPANVVAGATMTAFTVEARKASGAVDTLSSATIGNTLTGTPSVRTVADFDNASDTYLLGTDNTKMEMGGGCTTFYVAAWVKRDSASADGLIVSKRVNSGSKHEWWLQVLSGGQCQFGVSMDGADNTDAQISSFGTGTWKFVEGWWVSGVGYAVRVNRGTPTYVADAGTPFTGTAPFRIGADHNNSTKCWDGGIGLVFIGTSETLTFANIGAGTHLPDETISADLYNGGKIPYLTELATATVAAAKRTGGSDGELLFMLDPELTVGITKNVSGTITLTNTNSVTTAVSGETAPAVETPAGTLSGAATAGVASYGDIVIARPGTYQFAAASLPLAPATSSSFTVS